MLEKVYQINFKALEKAKQRGYCLCDVNKAEDDANVCPCNEFLNSGICKCLVYQEVNSN